MIYLDNASTTHPKPESVYQAMDHFARNAMANPGRGGHRRAVAAERHVREARHLLNQLLGGGAPERFAFTLNCTDALNMAIKGVLQDGDHVITTTLEHNSVLRPLQARERQGRIALTRIPANADGLIDPGDVERTLKRRTRIVAIAHASNVLGTVQPIAEVARLARDHGALVLVDAAQTAGVVPIDVESLGIDLLAFPGHKALLGPTGTGGLYVGPRVEMRPWREGGTGGDSALPTQPQTFPDHLEAGTPNVLGIVGLAEGVRYVATRGVEAIYWHESKLIGRLVAHSRRTGDFRIYGRPSAEGRVGTISIGVDGVPAADLGTILDECYGIAVRAGLHCAPGAHRSLGTFPDGTVRVSPGPFTREGDIDALCLALSEIGGEFSAAAPGVAREAV
jgi:cysteine desulfurase family protein